jgi:CheY-like chemotaxis protein
MGTKKILVVDDEKINLNLFENFLSNRGYEVVVVNDSAQVLSAVTREGPGAIIMDIVMPGQGGDKIAEQLKNHAGTRHIPIILITADMLKSSDNLYADYFIRRPVMGDHLLKILADIFGES